MTAQVSLFTSDLLPPAPRQVPARPRGAPARSVRPLAMGDRLELELTDLSLNRRRFYVMIVTSARQLEMFVGEAPLELVVLYGRQGCRPLSVRREAFGFDLAALTRRWRELEARRRRHGYQPVPAPAAP
jgi:predicted DNA-binding WGR domain protein